MAVSVTSFGLGSPEIAENYQIGWICVVGPGHVPVEKETIEKTSGKNIWKTTVCQNERMNQRPQEYICNVVFSPG